MLGAAAWPWRSSAFLIAGARPRRRRSIAATAGVIARETRRARAAGADADEAARLDLLGIGRAKGHGEVREHLLVREVLGRERALARVDDALLGLVLGFALLGGWFLVFAGGAPGPVCEAGWGLVEGRGG